MSDFLGNNDGGVGRTLHQGMLYTKLEDNGYPKVDLYNPEHPNLKDLYNSGDLRVVNHLFIESTFNASGYYEYDSAQNFAHLKDDNNFAVYKELGSYDSGGNRPTLKHGQFFGHGLDLHCQ